MGNSLWRHKKRKTLNSTETRREGIGESVVGFLSERKSWRQCRDHSAALSDRETEAAIKGHRESTRPPEAPPRDFRGQLQGGEGRHELPQAPGAPSCRFPGRARPGGLTGGLRRPPPLAGPRSARPGPLSGPERAPSPEELRAAFAPVDASSRCQAPSRVCPPPGPPGARPPTPSQLRLGGGARPGPKRGPDAAATSATCHRPGRLLLPRPRPPHGPPAGSSRDA